MKRAGVFVIYHAKGEVDRSVQYYLSKLAPFLDRLLIVVNGNLTDAGRNILLSFSEEVYQRENVGYDVGAFQFGIQTIGFEALKEYDELIVANDSVFGPVYPLEELFETMEGRKELDFWGVTGQLADKSEKFEDNPSGYMLSHIQSYFTVFKKTVLCATCFEKYWTELPIMKNRLQAIERHETYMTEYFAKYGFQWDVYVPMKERYILYRQPVFSMKEYHCPFIKKATFTLNAPYDCERNGLALFLRDNTEYDISMIIEATLGKMEDNEIIEAIDAFILDKERQKQGELVFVIKRSKFWTRIRPLRIFVRAILTRMHILK